MGSKKRTHEAPPCDWEAPHGGPCVPVPVDHRTPCRECGARHWTGMSKDSTEFTCGDCLERRTPLLKEIERLRTVIRTGGAMYRAERAVMLQAGEGGSKT